MGELYREHGAVGQRRSAAPGVPTRGAHHRCLQMAITRSALRPAARGYALNCHWRRTVTCTSGRKENRHAWRVPRGIGASAPRAQRAGRRARGHSGERRDGRRCAARRGARVCSAERIVPQRRQAAAGRRGLPRGAQRARPAGVGDAGRARGARQRRAGATFSGRRAAGPGAAGPAIRRRRAGS